jgi:hypothetical protein
MSNPSSSRWVYHLYGTKITREDSLFLYTFIETLDSQEEANARYHYWTDPSYNGLYTEVVVRQQLRCIYEKNGLKVPQNMALYGVQVVKPGECGVEREYPVIIPPCQYK